LLEHVLYTMEVPIAFPVADCKSPELYTLEQKQDALSVAERELETALALAEDFFETREEMDATLHTLRQHPDQPYSKPFMKKITAAILRVNACQQEVEWASESVEDTSLTPAQVKAQVKQMVEAQRVALECHLEKRMHAERAEWMSQIHQLRDELDEERRHRKAFQSKVKDFSEDVWIIMATECTTMYDSHFNTLGIRKPCEQIRKMLGILEPVHPVDKYGLRLNIVYKRAGITEADCCYTIDEYNKNDKGVKTHQKQLRAVETFTITTFDGTEK